MIERDLNPCPFCGSENVEVTTDLSGHYAYVSCQELECGARGPLSVTAAGLEWREVVSDSAAYRWNERVGL